MHGQATISRALATFAALVGTVALTTPAFATAPPAPGAEVDPLVMERVRERMRAPVERGFTRRVQAAASARAALRAGLKVAPETAVVSGTTYAPVVMVTFSDTGADPYPVSDLQTQLFDGPWPTGTMTEYYDEISYGNLNVTGTVFDWVELDETDTYYGCNGLCGSAKIGELIVDSVQDLDGSVDFGLYDNDGADGVPNSGDDDGYVDFIAFVHPEAGGECGNSNIWSHRWVLSGWGVFGGYQTNDARTGGGSIRIQDYVIQPALSCNGVDMIEIGVFAHEFGHAFGLPDLYDTDGSSQGNGEWALMASGSWGGNGFSPWSPSHMAAWAKEYLGWVTPTVVSDSQLSVQVPSASAQSAAVKIPFGSPVSSNEYFLVENRQQTGFDQTLRAGGLLIWHVDQSKWNGSSNNANTGECIDGPVDGDCGSTHFTVALEQADGDFDLEQGRNRSDSGDPFRAPTYTDFNEGTTPWSRDYSSNAPIFPTIENISASGATMTMDVLFGDAPLEPPCVDADGDGYGDPAAESCTFTLADCDDSDPDVNPGAMEVGGNSVDENCNASDLCGSIPAAGGSAGGALGLYAIAGAGFLAAARRKRRN